MVKIKSFGNVLLQLLAFGALLWVCNRVVDALHLAIPGSVLGMGVLVLLLIARLVPERAVQAGSAMLLGELMLFFIPPVVSVVKYQVLLHDGGWVIATNVVLGTLIALIGTGWVVDRIYTLEKRMREKAHAEGSA